MKPRPATAARRKTPSARAPAAKSVVPQLGDFPCAPSGRRNRTLPRVNRCASARKAASCHQGALVRSGRQRDPVSVPEEFVEPGLERIAPAERRVHPDEPAPVASQAIAAEEPVGRDMRPRVGRVRDIEIEGTAERVEDVAWRVPLIRLAEGFPCAHAGTAFRRLRFGARPSARSRRFWFSMWLTISRWSGLTHSRLRHLWSICLLRGT